MSLTTMPAAADSFVHRPAHSVQLWSDGKIAVRGAK